MNQIFARLLLWLRSQDGATALEYAFIVGGIAMLIIAAVFVAGDSLTSLWDTMAAKMSSVAGKA